MAAPVNRIGDVGAGALAEGLKEMTNLKELNLESEYCMDAVAIVYELAVMSWIKQGAGWCAHGETGRGAKGNNDVVVVTEGLILWVRGHGYMLSKECLVAWLEIEVCC